MTDPSNRTAVRRAWRSSRWQIIVGIALLLAMAAWLLPRPVNRILTIGGNDAWRADAAPAVREYVWRTPAPVESRQLPTDNGHRFVSPFLADFGATLYFSRSEPGQHADIFRTRLVDGEWLPAEPLDEVNSPFDELGATLSRDGRSLYFYSDRPGGPGGTDIWVSHRIDGRWAEPICLGQAANSPFDEIDPALSPDGKSLFFASNRNDDPLPKQRVGDSTDVWTTTLRAQASRPTFDLYRADRNADPDSWNSATPLAAVNEAGSSEGAAFVSSDGLFLYFASDRPNRHGEPLNLDLYRARLNGDAVDEPTNLGAGVNTSADETEPALSPEGFTLVFSSNRDGIDRLYDTRAMEVSHDFYWDTSHLGRFRNGWLLAGVLVSVVLLAWLILQRQRIWDRVWPARFFLGSVLINCMLLLLLAAWRFPEVFDAVARTFDESIPAPEMLDESEHQSHEDGREAYEKVADLKAVESDAIPEVVRRVTEAASVPERTERLAPTVPAEVATTLPPERVIFQPPKEVVVQSATADSPLIRRRSNQPVEMAAVSDLPEIELPSEELPAAQQVAQTEARVQESERQSDTNPELKEAVDEFVAAKPDSVQLREVESPAAPQPLTSSPARPPVLRRPQSRPVAIAAADDAAIPEAPVGAETPQLEAPDSAANAVERSPTATESTAAARVAAVDVESNPVPRAVALASRPVDQQLPDAVVTLTAQAPLQQRTRPRRVTSAVSTEDASVPEAVAAADVAAQPTVGGVRPRLTRSAAPLASSTTQSAVAPSDESRMTASVASRIAPTETRRDDLDLTIASVVDNPLKSRMRRGRPSTPTLVAALDDAAAEATRADSVPNDDSVEAADAILNRRLGRSTTEMDPAFESVAAAGNLPGARVSRQRPTRAIRRAATDAIVAATALPQNPLLRRRPMRTSPSATTIQAVELNDDAPDAGEVTGGTKVAASDAQLARADVPLVTSPVPTPQELTGPVTRVRDRIIVGELSEQANEAPPAFSPIVSRLNRRRAKAMKVALAEDNVGLQALLTLRQGDTRRQHIKLLGGSDESETAVNLGLDWLAKNQEPDGSWNLQKHQGSTRSFTAGTGLGVLPFLAAGYTHNMDGKYKDNVARAVRWLVEHQNKETGDLLSAGDQQRMYSHGIAAIALCEAFGMSQDPDLREPAQSALKFIVSAQHKPSGGWRYNPNERADTSVVGWQMMALKSGEMAGLQVPSEAYQLVAKWFDSVEARTGPGGTFGYQNRSATPAMTAEGLLCLQFMGTNRNSPKMRFGADFLLKQLPQENQARTSYYWYYATQVMYHMQGDYWEKWNEQTRDLLVRTQHKSGGNAGTWNPRDNWERSGGRVYATSIKLLMLEVYYRHLPLYDQLEL